MATNKPENLSWAEYLIRLEKEIKARPDSDSFLISSQTVNGVTTQFRPISELREEYNMVKQRAASEQLGDHSPFLADCEI